MAIKIKIDDYFGSNHLIERTVSIKQKNGRWVHNTLNNYAAVNSPIERSISELKITPLATEDEICEAADALREMNTERPIFCGHPKKLTHVKYSRTNAYTDGRI